MNKTKIPWCDYTINPVKGLCPMACEYCYARRMYKRFKWNPEIRFDWSVANDLAKIKEPSHIFWGSTMELFGEWVDTEWMRLIFEATKRHPEHTHVFLTKQPHNLIKYSPFPDNCWIGMSVDKYSRYGDITDTFASIVASVKFVSFEPMLDYTPPDLRYVDWVIIGSLTQPTKHPPLSNVKHLISLADEAKIPVFIKEPLASYMDVQRQEYPIRD